MTQAQVSQMHIDNVKAILATKVREVTFVVERVAIGRLPKKAFAQLPLKLRRLLVEEVTN